MALDLDKILIPYDTFHPQPTPSPHPDPSPMTPTTPGERCRTPRRRLLLDSAESSPQSSPDSVKPSPVHFHKKLVSKMLFSPEPSPEDLDDVASAVKEMRLNESRSRRCFFPRSSSMNADENSKRAEADDFPMPLSPIQADEAGSHVTASRGRRIYFVTR